MDFAISEEEQSVVDLARKILEDHCDNERLKALEASGADYDENLWRALADASLLGTAVGQDHGGVELGYLALCLFLQQIGRSVAPVPTYASLVLGAAPLARFGSEDLKSELLPGVASGERILSGALTELESSDPLRPATRTRRAGEEWVLDGCKSHVPYAAQASHILIPATTDDGNIELFFVAPGDDGVTLTPQTTSNRQPHAQLELRGTTVSDSRRLSGGRQALCWTIQHATTALCMMQLGVVERALEMTAEYSRERVQFDRPIGSFQAVHQRAADAYINVEAIRLSALEAAWRLSNELDAEEHVMVAKFWAAEGGHLASFACQHLHGGIGIDVDYPLHRYFQWAIQIEHELGSAKHQLDRLGKQIAAGGLPAS